MKMYLFAANVVPIGNVYPIPFLYHACSFLKMFLSLFFLELLVEEEKVDRGVESISLEFCGIGRDLLTGPGGSRLISRLKRGNLFV